MAWYIDENHTVHRFCIVSPTAIKLNCNDHGGDCSDHGKVIEDPCAGSVWAVDPTQYVVASLAELPK